MVGDFHVPNLILSCSMSKSLNGFQLRFGDSFGGGHLLN